jgi:hypothetical protein
MPTLQAHTSRMFAMGRAHNHTLLRQFKHRDLYNTVIMSVQGIRWEQGEPL